MRLDQTGDLWWKNAIVYCVDVELYLDSDGDGVGDFRGLTRQLDHIAGLGVTCIWLMPFYATPNRDDGYDITDYYAIESRLGTFGDFAEFLATASDRGIRVIVDLVLNHTSDQHPWFKDSRSSRDSKRRDFYVWRDEPSDKPAGLAFPDKETSNWELDPATGQYYLHRFYSHQPDLNTANPEVRDEITRIVSFWLSLGVAGFRLDAVPFMLEQEGLTAPVDDDDMHTFLSNLRAFASRRRGDALFLGEVNTGMHELQRFFGGDDADALQMQFGFMVNQHLWLALAREDAEPLEQMVKALPPAPPDAGWATFLRNHDEQSMDKLTISQREEVFAAFAPDPSMQMYGHGIRRRVAPMLGGDGPRLRMAWSLMFSLPGSPVVYMGDEIGMGEQLEIEDRYAVRVPMQWSGGENGGFSAAAPEDLVRPQPSGAFAPAKVNVADQRHDPDSLLNWLERLIRRRRETPEFGFGTSTLIPIPAPEIFAHRCSWDGSEVVAVHNLAAAAMEITLPLGEEIEEAENILVGGSYKVRKGKLDLSLEGYGGLWLRLRAGGAPPRLG